MIVSYGDLVQLEIYNIRERFFMTKLRNCCINYYLYYYLNKDCYY